MKTTQSVLILSITLIVISVYTSNFLVLDSHSADDTSALSDYNILSEEEEENTDVDLAVHRHEQVVEEQEPQDSDPEKSHVMEEKSHKLNQHLHLQKPHAIPPKKTDCEFLAEDEGPIPVILFALGRSGSSITWNVMSNLTGHENIANEKVREKGQFLEDIVNNPKTTHNWALYTLCSVQHQRYIASGNKKATGIAGFQWKPFKISLEHEYGIEGLRRVAEQRNPAVRAIVLTRNFLDMRYSRLKHTEGIKKFGKKNKIPDHCRIDDESCLKKHLNLVSNQSVVFPSGRNLKNELRAHYIHHNQLIQLLESVGIDYVKVSYEKLYDSDSAEEWMRIFKYLGRGPSVDLTMEEVRGAMGLKRTNKKSKSPAEMISNFEEVRKTLKGTKYESLLSTWM